MSPAAETFADSAYVAELATPIGDARIARFSLDRPTDRVFRRADRYWLDLCLTPRPEHARGCYTERWGPHRFERLGEMFLVPPHESLHIRTDVGADQVSIVCEIDAAAVDRWIDAPIEWTDRRLAAGLDITHPYLRSCLYRLAQEARYLGPDRAALAEAIVIQLSIELARYCRAIADGPIAGGLAQWRLRLIDERLGRTGPPPTLEELAAACNMSVRQLTRGFRASRGCSVGDYVAQSRIDLAKRQLGGDDSIKVIAFGLGFASPSSFSYAFRRATGSSPREFRQRQLRRIDPAG